MPADLDEYFTAFQAETMSTPAEPTTLRRAAERRVRRRVTTAVSAAALATVAVLGTAVALTTSTAGPSTQNGAACQNADLRMAVAGRKSRAVGYSLTNVARRSCSLSGFMTTRHIDSDGALMEIYSQPVGESHTITLKPAETGYFWISYNYSISGALPLNPPNCMGQLRTRDGHYLPDRGTDRGRGEYYLPGQEAPLGVDRGCPAGSEGIHSFSTAKDPGWSG